MERYDIPGTARASLGMYNTLAEVDLFAERPRTHRPRRRSRAPVLSPTMAYPYPGAKRSNPTEAAADLAEFFDFVEDWTERYQ